MKLGWRLPPAKGDLALIYAAVLAAWAAVAGLRLFFKLPLPPCLFRYFTGCPCVGCGSTRAASALLQLRISEALAWNPLAASAMIGAALFCIWAVASRLLHLPRPHLEITPTELRWAGVFLGILLAANWLYLIWRGV
ncbi:MAG: DUF2752 domain-containing protein [Planctomycetota bacterium]|nr:DUF2752 domain-containing protein [Planctomycetota bacterium]